MITPPVIESLDSLLPPEPLLMMGAGPVPIPARVAAANSIVINHLGETMAKVITQMQEMARYVFQTRTPWILGVAGPGSAAMEMGTGNMIRHGDKVLCVVNGYFGERFAEMARRAGGDVSCFEVGDTHPLDLAKFKKELARVKPVVVTVTQGETATTTCNTQLAEICRLAHEQGCYVIVDAVCTASTMPLQMDDWHIDVLVTGGQKGLSCIPGVSLIAFSQRAWDRILQRPTAPLHWTLDAQLASNFWHKASYHYTAPVSGILALHEALKLVIDETLPVRFERHLRCSLALQRGVEAMGLQLFAAPEVRLNSVVGVRVPQGIDRAAVCKHISAKYRVEISGSFGLHIVRVGQMGEQCRVHHLFRTLHAIGSTMQDLGASVDIPSGMAELEREIQR